MCDSYKFINKKELSNKSVLARLLNSHISTTNLGSNNQYILRIFCQPPYH